MLQAADGQCRCLVDTQQLSKGRGARSILEHGRDSLALLGSVKVAPLSGSFQKADGSGNFAARGSFRGSFIGGAIALTAPASGSISARGRGDKEARALGRQESRSGRQGRRWRRRD